MAPVTLTGISPRRIPVGEPIFRLFRHGWRRAKAFSFPVAALPFHIVNRSCLPGVRGCRRASCRACLRIFLAILRWIRGAV
ncbi:hypothetical protein IPC224_26780 [Pseudomonas aeruginosa]|nr:hypothetical protein IPC224_26780 [Pseudomonas aeruginosa]